MKKNLFKRRTTRSAISFCEKHYDVSINITSLKDGIGGMANGPANLIYISDQHKSLSVLLSLVFHEIGHIYCWRNNKWPSYHGYFYRNSHLDRSVMLTAFKAEKWVDYWGEKEMKNSFPIINILLFIELTLKPITFS